MSKKEQFNIKEVEVLLLVKLLHEYTMLDEDGEECDYTLSEKIERFDISSARMEIEEFEAGLDKMEETGILVWNEEEDTYEVTEIGRTLFKRLSLVEGLDDNGIKNILNASFSIQNFWNEHGNEIKDIMLTVLKAFILK